MTQINDLKDLRDHALNALKRLESGECDVKEVAVIGKLSETIIAGVRVQMEYAHALGREPKIDFVGDCLGAKTISYMRQEQALLEKNNEQLVQYNRLTND